MVLGKKSGPKIPLNLKYLKNQMFKSSHFLRGTARPNYLYYMPENNERKKKNPVVCGGGMKCIFLKKPKKRT
jgi:hypothetical protein